MATPTPTSRSSGRPSRSASAIVAVTESGQHLLKIDGYSHTKDAVPTGSNIKSQPFRVGGYDWRILYYPNGLNSSFSDYISLFLQLDSNVPQGVMAQYTFSLLDREGRPVPYVTSSGIRFFTDWGTTTFIRRDELEKSPPRHLQDDCLTIVCDVTVAKEIQTKSVDLPSVAVPPPDLHRHLGGLLETAEGADVAFEVDGRTFLAHRCVLAARSPVLRAELSDAGLTAAAATNKGTDSAAPAVVVRVDDMEARDFEALLRYMYTDSLPDGMTEQGEAAAMLPDLVAAANRYQMERLRLLCEAKLCEFVNARTVAIILAFAREHHCHGLQEACMRFLNDPKNLRLAVRILEDLIAKLASSPD